MKIFLVSMGCAKNSVDSEYLSGTLIAHGHEVVAELDAEASEHADVAIINTCGFIQDAVKENIDAILDLEELKNHGLVKKLIVAGCLVNRYESELRKELPSVDLFVRSEEWERVINFLNGAHNHNMQNCERSVIALNKNFWTRYLKISEGCNTLCSYCAIPLIRGRLRSVPIEKIISEAKILCAAGARELCLVGQDLTVYGQDFSDGTNLQGLIRELQREIPDDTWLRLFYLHPKRVDERFVDFVMSCEKVLHYLDVPIQHIDPEILSLMNRPCEPGHIERIFRYIRECDEKFALRTTIMTGFNGETDEKFDRLLDFLEEIRFDFAGTFAYSPEEGTLAAKLRKPARVGKKVANFRANKLSELQSRISHERSELFLNHELRVLVEDIDRESGEVWGRTFRDAPEIDGMTCASSASGNISKLKLGDFVNVKILDCEAGDLFGEIL